MALSTPQPARDQRRDGVRRDGTIVVPTRLRKRRNAARRVQFSDTSAGPPTTWAWDLGGGLKSSEQNPTVVYDKPGTYLVTLTVRHDRPSLR
jgi:hypothetical protein